MGWTLFNEVSFFQAVDSGAYCAPVWMILKSAWMLFDLMALRHAATTRVLALPTVAHTMPCINAGLGIAKTVSNQNGHDCTTVVLRSMAHQSWMRTSEPRCFLDHLTDLLQTAQQFLVVVAALNMLTCIATNVPLSKQQRHVTAASGTDKFPVEI